MQQLFVPSMICRLFSFARRWRRAIHTEVEEIGWKPMPRSFFARRRFAALGAVCFAAMLVSSAGSLCAAVTLKGDTSNPDTSTFALGEPVELKFSVAGAGSYKNLELQVVISDEKGREIASREVDVTPDAGGKWQATLPAPADKLGFYRVKARLSNGIELSALGSRKGGYLTYAVVPPPSGRPEVPEKEAFFGMQGGYNKGWSDAVKELLGIRWILDGSFEWKRNEPRRAGEYTPPANPSASATGGWQTFTLPTFFMAPDWAVKKETLAYNTGTLTSEGEKAWDAYCRKAALAYAEKNPDREERIYQITWEPNQPWGFKGTDEDLIRIHEIAYKAIHETDDKAVVAGPTRGLEKADIAQTTAILRQGLGKAIDAFTIHPYFTLQPERDGMVGMVRNLMDNVRAAAGKDISFLGTEQGFSTHEDAGEELDHARGLIRQSLITKGEGFRFNIAFFITDYRLGEQHGYGYYYTLVDGVPWGPVKVGPKPVVPAYAAQSLLLEGYRPAGAIEWLGDTVLGYAFERGKDVILALWDFGKEPQTVSLPAGTKEVRVYDWMGNERTETTAAGNLTVTLGPEPIYVRGASPQIWSRHVDKLIDVSPSVVKVYPGAEAAMEVAVKNNAAEPLRAELVIGGDERLGLPASREPIDLPPGESRTVPLKWKIPLSATSAAFPAKMTLERDGATLAIGGATVDIAPVATISSIRPVALPKDQTAVAVTIRDQTGRGMKGTLKTRIEGMKESVRQTEFEVPASGEVDVMVDCSALAAETSLTYMFEATIETAGGAEISRTAPLSFLTARRLSASKPGKWSSVVLSRKNLIRSPKYYSGDDDLSATISWAWDDRALHVHAEVIDDAFHQRDKDVNTWRGDSLQLAFDLDPLREEQVTGNLLADTANRSRYTEVAAALTAKGPEIYRHISFDPEGLPLGIIPRDKIAFKVRQAGGRIVYDIAISWQAMGATAPPKAGEVIGVAVTVNDADDAGQKDPSALGLFGGIVPKKAPERFGLLVLGGGDR